MNEQKQPGIKFYGIFIIEESFSRKPNVPLDAEEDLEMSSELSVQGKDATVMVETIFKLEHNDEEVFRLQCKHIGKFSVDTDNENMELQTFIENNSVAIMFPYIREHITSVTQKAGIQPIVLPPINIRALLNNK
ncbi:protein-export chaperone SecB [Clostridium perfringens]|uniref:protein-export chaperone SecB n=1 Tax=Clostridium perfringens TaxID=1502 RepID=UPI0024BC43A3|nr:protein-export chaperone SecB [Clostridium perfringens]